MLPIKPQKEEDEMPPSPLASNALTFRLLFPAPLALHGVDLDKAEQVAADNLEQVKVVAAGATAVATQR